jgi:hypothetical protein
MFHFAIIDRDLTIHLGDEFVHWWCTSGLDGSANRVRRFENWTRNPAASR